MVGSTIEAFRSWPRVMLTCALGFMVIFQLSGPDSVINNIDDILPFALALDSPVVITTAAIILHVIIWSFLLGTAFLAVGELIKSSLFYALRIDEFSLEAKIKDSRNIFLVDRLRRAQLNSEAYFGFVVAVFLARMVDSGLPDMSAWERAKEISVDVIICMILLLVGLLFVWPFVRIDRATRITSIPQGRQ